MNRLAVVWAYSGDLVRLRKAYGMARRRDRPEFMFFDPLFRVKKHLDSYCKKGVLTSKI